MAGLGHGDEVRQEEEGEEGLDLDIGLWAGEAGADVDKGWWADVDVIVVDDCLCEPEEVMGVSEG